ncbi:oxidoreductase [Pseudomonas sp. S9]|uniref:oxidoreductase n=1 Tax=Pseudomonas sp. S9 TaxID=686578 RepID=UPI0011108A8D|nr:oxidoreductase [Pseudomonas sp. S9]
MVLALYFEINWRCTSHKDLTVRLFRLTLFGFLVCCLGATSGVLAAPAYPPSRPALSVQLNDGHSINLSLNDLTSMPKRVLTTSEPNDSTVVEWTGVDLGYLLTHLNIAPDSYSYLRLDALNMYSVMVPREDIQRFNPIIAYLRNGKSMPISEYGPLYLIYPFDLFPELNAQVYFNRSIWQLSKISLINE